jgi:large subunit ribosomal protein L6
MSRIAKQPIPLPKGVEVTLTDENVTVKGQKGQLSMVLHSEVLVNEANSDEFGPHLNCAPRNDSPKMHPMVGTSRALLSNMVHGVTEGFERELELIGVGYRAQVQGSKINLSLGFSHPVVYDLPEGVTAEMPSNTNLILRSINKQLVGQCAAEIRSIRPPEPYKGKGVRYKGEQIVRKETKKK